MAKAPDAVYVETTITALTPKGIIASTGTSFGDSLPFRTFQSIISGFWVNRALVPSYRLLNALRGRTTAPGISRTLVVEFSGGYGGVRRFAWIAGRG